jgi:hypothetical protein
LGMAIAAWQFVESSLFTIYATAFDVQSVRANYDALNAAFHVPSGFRVRLDMTSAALARAGLSDNLQAQWAGLSERAVKRSKRRNQLAHAVVCFQPYERPVGKQLFLTQNLTNIANRDSGLSQGSIIGQKELDEMRVSFEELSQALTDFAQAMMKIRLEESPERSPIQKT